jgi:hypothetical protein
MVGIRWSVWGDDVIERDLLRFEERTIDPRPAFIAIHEDMTDHIREHFDTEGAHGGARWKPLKEETILAKQAAGLPPAILHATLALRDSLIDMEGDNHIFEADSDGFTFGSSDPKGRFHQEGTVNMPQRRPINFTEIQKVGFMKTLQRYMIEGSLGAGAAV